MSLRLLRRAFGCAIALAVGLPAAAPAQAHWYRYSLSTRSGDPRYVLEIPSCVSGAGRCFEVERDARRRMVRVATFRDGKKVQEIRYRFAGTDTLPSGYDIVSATGEMTERDALQRNARGERTIDSSFTLQGGLTDYEVRTYRDSSVEQLNYSAEGKQTARYVYYNTPQGIVNRSRWYPNDSTYYESLFDVSTGLSLSRRKVQGDSLQSSNRYTYGPDGSLIRDDVYDAQGSWYGMREYTQGLKRREYYKFNNGDQQETVYTYDDRRWTKEAKFSRNGTVVCTFMYDRFPDGTVKRTLALGPAGDLMAEYPDQAVDKVLQSGQPIDGGTATLYKKTDWW